MRTLFCIASWDLVLDLDLDLDVDHFVPIDFCFSRLRWSVERAETGFVQVQVQVQVQDQVGAANYPVCAFSIHNSVTIAPRFPDVHFGNYLRSLRLAVTRWMRNMPKLAA